MELLLSSDTAAGSMKVDEESVIVVARRTSSCEAEDWDQRRAVAITGAKTALVRREA